MTKVVLQDLISAADILDENTKEAMRAEGMDDENPSIDAVPRDFLNRALDWTDYGGNSDELLAWVAKCLLPGGLAARKEATEAIESGDLPPRAAEVLDRVIYMNCYLAGMQLGMKAMAIARERDDA